MSCDIVGGCEKKSGDVSSRDLAQATCRLESNGVDGIVGRVTGGPHSENRSDALDEYGWRADQNSSR